MYHAKVSLPDSDIKDYFESNPGEFDTPKTVEASHVLIKVDQNANPELVEKLGKKRFQFKNWQRKERISQNLRNSILMIPAARTAGILALLSAMPWLNLLVKKPFP